MVIDRERRIAAYRFVKALLAEGISQTEVILRTHNKFSIPSGTIRDWVYGTSRPWGVGQIHVCPELFYVLGALLGDGCAYRWGNRGEYKLILVGDKAFARKYARKLSRCTGRRAKAYINRSKNIWFVTVGNAELFFLFKSIRCNPKLILRRAREGDYAVNGIAFVEGFFDAEGCVKLVKETVRKTPKVCLDLTNTNYELLELVREFLQACLNIEARYSSQEAHIGSDGHPRKKSYHLRIYKKDDARKFLDNINTTKLTKRKRPSVRKWLSVSNCNTRYFCNACLLAPN